jgi:hypothetical protein
MNDLRPSFSPRDVFAPPSIAQPAGPTGPVGAPGSFAIRASESGPSNVAASDEALSAAVVRPDAGPRAFMEGRLKIVQTQLQAIDAQRADLRSAGRSVDDPAFAELDDRRRTSILDLQSAAYDMTMSVALVSQAVGAATKGAGELLRSQS